MLAEEQAASRRVAMLGAQGVPQQEVCSRRAVRLWIDGFVDSSAPLDVAGHEMGFRSRSPIRSSA